MLSQIPCPKWINRLKLDTLFFPILYRKNRVSGMPLSPSFQELISEHRAPPPHSLLLSTIDQKTNLVQSSIIFKSAQTMHTVNRGSTVLGSSTSSTAHSAVSSVVNTGSVNELIRMNHSSSFSSSNGSSSTESSRFLADINNVSSGNITNSGEGQKEKDKKKREEQRTLGTSFVEEDLVLSNYKTKN